AGRRAASLQCMILLALLLAAAPRVVYVKAGRLFDGLSESYRQNVALKIENDRIAATNVSIPPGAPVIDLSNATVLPGLIDFHVADGADQLRHVIRAHVQHGVDVIKVAASGGVFSRGDTPGAPQFTYEELRVAVEEAHKAGRRIAAHAHGTQSIKDATRAGIDSIEHGTLIDDEGIRLMKERGTFLVGDVYNDDYILAHAEALRIPPECVDKERAIGQI